ncbi:hypothetical protein B7463_g8665, partial [Scytalidium lignicola]
MVQSTTFTVAAVAALLCALPVNAGLYSKSSPVLQVDAKSYDRLIAQSNHTSIVEFYAPWCGHCKNLQPIYEKVAKNLAGLAKVAAVDCDDDANKQLCGSMGVQGFPTLKIVKPGSKPGRPIVEDYQGPRTAKGIAEAVVDKIPNLVQKVSDKDIESYLKKDNETAKAILFTDKGRTSALLRAVAIDFKGSINVAQIRNTDKEKECLEIFGITKVPTLVLLPGGDAESIVYDDELKKDSITSFLSQIAAPNPDPAPQKPKPSKKKNGNKAPKEETVEEDKTESPSQETETEKPIVAPEPAPPIPTLGSEQDLEKECLGSRTSTCILAFVASREDEPSKKALDALAEIAHKHHQAKRNIFPFYVVTKENTAYARLVQALDLKRDVEVLAVNTRRGWWRELSGDDLSAEVVESWVDSIRLGEGEKKKFPEGMIPEEEPTEEPIAEETSEPAAEEVKEEEAAETESEEKTSHDEL